MIYHSQLFITFPECDPLSHSGNVIANEFRIFYSPRSDKTTFELCYNLSMSLSVIADINGHQYLLNEKSILDVDHIKDSKEGQKIKIDKILAVIDGDKTEIDPARLAKIEVTAKITKNFKGPKTSQITFKAKSRYRRHRGWRRTISRLEIEKISLKKAVAKKTSQGKKTIKK